MSEIGYYNYYNNPHRIIVDSPKDRYADMVERYEANKDTLHAHNENPYSENNLKRREFEENLSKWAEGVRTQCKTEADVRSYLAKKYFGKECSTFMDRLNLDDATRAAYDNDLNAILYGTYHTSKPLDPRMNWTQKDWDTQEAEEKAFNKKRISEQMSNLLAKNGVSLSDNDNLLISFNPYNFNTNVESSSDVEMLNKITQLLNGDNNSQQLMYFVMNNTSNLNSDSVSKFRAYREVMKHTGLDLSKLNLKDGEFYTNDNQKLTNLLVKAIDDDNSIGLEFKGAAFEVIKSYLDTVAQKGWNGIEDLDLKIGYSKNNGFYLLSQIYEA